MITRRTRSGAHGEPQPLSPRSLNTLPTEVLLLHLWSKRLTTTGPRAALVRWLRGHLRSTGAGGGAHTPSDDGSDPSGSKQLDDPEDRAAPAPSSEGGESSPADLDPSGSSASKSSGDDEASPPRPRGTTLRSPRHAPRLRRRPPKRSRHASPGSPRDRPPPPPRRSRHDSLDSSGDQRPSRHSRHAPPDNPRDRHPSRRSHHDSPDSSALAPRTSRQPQRPPPLQALTPCIPGQL